MKSLALAVTLFAGAQVPAFGALDAYLKLVKPTTGQIKGDLADGRFKVIRFASAGLSADEQSSLQMNATHHAWKPIVIWIKPSVDLQVLKAALAAKTKLDWELDATRTSANNTRSSYVIKLTNAVLTAMTQVKRKNGQPAEELQFTFQKIAWTTVNTGKTATDDWNAQS